ncbi:MAG: hypothetical protein NTV46_06835 [Verrucomicrobia bacterium]|nr:hypothetical protein [Verrucomicrobiota bacterium]
MAFRSHLYFELLRCACKPIGELEACDVPLALATQETIARAEIADNPNRVENRAFARSVRTAENTERLEMSLEGNQAPEIVGVKS